MQDVHSPPLTGKAATCCRKAAASSGSRDGAIVSFAAGAGVVATLVLGAKGVGIKGLVATIFLAGVVDAKVTLAKGLLEASSPEDAEEVPVFHLL